MGEKIVEIKNDGNFRMARRYCKDPIEKIPGYENALNSDELYVCHHVLELNLDGERVHTVDELIRMGMYYNRPYFELVFLSNSEHSSLHNKGKNNFAFRIKDVESHHRNISESLKGHRGWNTGKHWSVESRQKMSVAQKRRQAMLKLEVLNGSNR